MLNDFRNVDVIWDKATKNFVKKIRVASSDERGRKLTVQVVNGGQVEDLTGSSLSLYWITENKEHQGLDEFTQVDAAQGIFEIYYTTEMLGNIGKLRANLHLTDEIGTVSSEQFFIEVFLGIDSKAVQSSDSFSTLNQALIEVQNIKQAEVERVANEEQRTIAEQERIENEQVRAEGYPLLDGRLTTVEQNIDFADISSGFSFASGVTSFHAYKFGRVVFLRFNYQPTVTGFNYNVVTTTLYKPRLQVAVSVATRQSTADSARGITSYFYGTGDGTGELTVVAPEVPGYPMLFTCMYLT